MTHKRKLRILLQANLAHHVSDRDHLTYPKLVYTFNHFSMVPPSRSCALMISNGPLVTDHLTCRLISFDDIKIRWGLHLW